MLWNGWLAFLDARMADAAQNTKGIYSQPAQIHNAIYHKLNSTAGCMHTGQSIVSPLLFVYRHIGALYGIVRFHGLGVMTQVFGSCSPGSSPGGTF